MNRKQKIIISVTGIFIVLLILVGLTYAYFLTRIQGNTNSKSISVTTADLKLTYGDGNGIITGEKIQPGTTLDTKTFTVTNEGNSLVTYGTAFIDMIYQDLSNNKDIDKFEYQDDLIYSLECTSYKTEGLTYNTDGTVQSGTETGECNGVTEGVLPTRTDLSLIITNKIEVGITHVYKLKITYKETGIDQSIDMNKKIEGKIDIIDLKRNSNELNPYSKNKESLAYNIINNAIENTNGTSFNTKPLTKITDSVRYDSKNYTIETINAADEDYTNWFVSDTLRNITDTVTSYKEAVGKYVYNQDSGWVKFLESFDEQSEILTFKKIKWSYEKSLSQIDDDYGISYYYRGNVKDNYVTFNNMCWRIIRIEGDGSIKLILEDQDEVCSENMDGNWDIATGNYGYDGTKLNKNKQTINMKAYLNPVTNKENAMSYLFQQFQNNKLSNSITKLKAGNWCMNEKAYADNSGTILLSNDEILNKYNNSEWIYYDSEIRLGKYQAMLKCNGTLLNKFNDGTGMYVATINADEAAFAGLSDYEPLSSLTYLNNSYQQSNSKKFFTLSPYIFVNVSEPVEMIYTVAKDGILSATSAIEDKSIRPTIILKNDTLIKGGTGTINNSYVVS